MKIFMLLSVATLALSLDAMMVTLPKAKPKPPVAAACAHQTEPQVIVVRPHIGSAANTCDPVELELSALPVHTGAAPSAPSPVHAKAPVQEPVAAPQSLYPVLPSKEKHPALAAVDSSKALVTVDLAADNKQAGEKAQLVIPHDFQEQITLKPLIRAKIAELFPKWPVQIYPDLLEEEATYQLGLCSRKTEQEIILSPTSRWKLEVFCQCIPLIHSKEQLIVQLQKNNSSIQSVDIDYYKLRNIVSAAITQKGNTLFFKIFKKVRNYPHAEYEEIEGLYKKIKALPDPKDRQLLEETVDIIWEEKPIPALAARAPDKPAKKSSCVIC